MSTDVPIACSLGGADLEARIADWQVILGSVTDRASISGGVRLELASSAPLADVVDLARAEHDCCRFFSFAITIDGRGVALEVTAPEGAGDLLEAVFGAAA